MVNNPLEFLAQKYGNVVKYDADGNPSVFVKFMKMKSSDLSPELPNHTHPAFIIDGVEQDYILLGKYKASELTSGGTLYSIPNVPPMRSLGADQLLSRMRAAGTGISGMTVADYGFILLLAQKMGWDPHGNNNWGQHYGDATVWETGKSVALNAVRAFEGYKYTCLIAHTTVAELRPDISPTYWQKGDYIGGISWDNTVEAAHQTGYRTLNGSGPLDWYLGSDPGNMADIIGSSLEANYGYRIVDAELQILENNNAADPDADLSATSSAWKAILPNASDDGFTLVTPGTAGTLHWNYDSNLILDTQCDVELGSSDNNKSRNFKDLTAHATRLPYVPYIIKELGLFPTTGSTMRGNYYVNFIAGERFPRRGGSYGNASYAGLGYVSSGGARGSTGTGYGARPRSLA